MSFSFSSSNKLGKKNINEEDKLCDSIQKMGTTFIKLGQFLSTRPDIIGSEISKQLEKLQDKLPPFPTDEAKKIIKKELGENNYNSLINISEPVAAASIAQVHKAQINDEGTIKDIAIKILRPNIKNIFNEEIDALMLLAFIIEGTLKKTKRLKLVEVVFLLKEITNLETDLRFEAAAASETLAAFPDAATAVPLASPLVAVTVAPAAAQVDSTRKDHCPAESAVAVPQSVPPEETVPVAPAPASLPYTVNGGVCANAADTNSADEINAVAAPTAPREKRRVRVILNPFPA